jgi:hypothetical protein
LFALVQRQPGEHIVHHLLWVVGREIGNFLGVERFRHRHQLFRIHRGDERFADGIGYFQQDLAIARGADQALDQTVPARKCGNFDERILHPLARFRAIDDLRCDGLCHGHGAHNGV